MKIYAIRAFPLLLTAALIGAAPAVAHEAHAELMKKFPGMEHDEPNMASVQPGQTGHVIWKFTQSGKVPFACLQAGHLDAGMKGSVSVASTPVK